MSRPKFALLIVLGVVGGFLATFVPSLASALGDDDTVSTTELSLAPPVRHDEPEPPTARPPQQARHPSVDRDCYEDGMVCKKSRLADAISVADLVTPIMSDAGWPAGCFEVQFIGGDDGELDAINIELNGRPKLGSPKCREPKAGDAQKSQVARVGQAVKNVLRKTPVSNVDLLQVTNGNNADVQINLK